MSEEKEPSELELTWGDRLLVERQELSPRHRKLCELAAQGASNKQIKEALGYKSDSQVSIILSNTRIRSEIERIRERIYEDTVGGRLKRMAEPALAELERCLMDQTNKYKPNLKVDTAKWLVEKLDGKAVQKYDVGENMLSVLMDRLDALKSGGLREIPAPIDVTPQVEAPESDAPAPPAPKSDEDKLRDWVTDFNLGD